MCERDWVAWHDDYDQPESRLARRLAAVQRQIRAALDEAPPGRLRAVSLCAGQGRDLIGALDGHPRAADVRARLVELDPRNAEAAVQAAKAADLPDVEVVVGDAARAAHYADLAPAHLVLVCGVFGNLVLDDVRRTIGHCAALCRTGGSVVWTRHRSVPDVVPTICGWFASGGFAQRWVSEPSARFGVGRHVRVDPPRPLDAGATMFTFVGHDRLRAAGQPPWWN